MWRNFIFVVHFGWMCVQSICMLCANNETILIIINGLRYLFIARWNHIEDLDSFFTRMYYYHQKHGFNIMMLGHILDLTTFAFVVWFVTSMVYCIDYGKLDG